MTMKNTLGILLVGYAGLTAYYLYLLFSVLIAFNDVVSDWDNYLPIALGLIAVCLWVKIGKADRFRGMYFGLSVLLLGMGASAVAKTINILSSMI